MSDPDAAIKAIAVAYNALLMMPHGSTRARRQPLLAACRDALAEELDMDPEEVQNIFDPISALMRR